MFDALGILALGQIPVTPTQAVTPDDISRPGNGSVIMLHYPGKVEDLIDDDDLLIAFAFMEGAL